MAYVNDQFFELTGQPREPLDQFEWAGLVADEDMKIVEDDWTQMLAGSKSDGVQVRLKKTWVNQEGVVSNIWVQSSNHPEVDEQGKVTSMQHAFRLFIKLTCFRYLGHALRHLGKHEHSN